MSRRWTLVLVALAAMLAAGAAAAQTVTLDLGDTGGSATGRIIQLMALVTILSLAPAILVTVTSFTRIIIVLSFLRNALGIQQTPPNTVLVSLALFLTGFVMAPTFERAWHDGVAPLIEEKMAETEAIEKAVAPLHHFMMGNVREQDLKLFVDIARMRQDRRARGDAAARPRPRLHDLASCAAPSRSASSSSCPFLIIDMVVASILMSMGMMMLPSAMISLPFKLIFFVLVDGWYLVAGSLVQSFGGTS